MVFGVNSKSLAQRRVERRARRIWRSADAVCFDVDSTVCKDEAIDEVAKFLGVGEKVMEVTQRAMGGSMSFREALSERLKVISPTREQMEQFLEEHPPKLSPGIEDLVNALHARGVHVYLVSGGFHSIILPVADRLKVPEKRIFANVLMFNDDDDEGSFAGFDPSCPTSDDFGKGEVVRAIRSKYGYKRVVVVGDGATDAEACPPADSFIGFGGNVVRDAVRRNAPWYVYSFSEMIAELAMESEEETTQSESDDGESGSST